jgi:hypothetical protein
MSWLRCIKRPEGDQRQAKVRQYTDLSNFFVSHTSTKIFQISNLVVAYANEQQAALRGMPTLPFPLSG